jgi:hypothetical protein
MHSSNSQFLDANRDPGWSMVRLPLPPNLHEDVIVFKVEKISRKLMRTGEALLNAGRLESSLNAVETCLRFVSNGGCHESAGSEVETRLSACHDEVTAERDFGSVRNAD